MNNPVQRRPVSLALRAIAKDAAAEGGAIQRAAQAGRPVMAVVAFGRGGREQQVRGGGGEVCEDGGVAGGAGLDDAAGEDIGVDDGEGVGRGGQEGGDGGFSCGDGAGEADNEHGMVEGRGIWEGEMRGG